MSKVTYINRTHMNRALNPCTRERADIPNQTGYKLLALLENGMEALLTVRQGKDGLHTLEVPIAHVRTWQPARPEWVALAREAENTAERAPSKNRDRTMARARLSRMRSGIRPRA